MTPPARSFPTGVLATGRIVHRLLSLGLPMGPLYLLQTRGRHTGASREVPIAVLGVGGDQWLVSPFGAVAWVHNVRANGEACLRRGAGSRRVHLVEVDDTRIPGLLRTYRRRFAAVPFVRAAFDATPRDPLVAFAREADHHPVFHVERTLRPLSPPRSSSPTFE